MDGIGPARVEELLRAVPRLTIEQKGEALGKMGYDIDGAQYGTITDDLIASADGGVDEALFAVLMLWLDHATAKDNKILQEAIRSGKGPKRDDQPPAIFPLFHWDGKPTILGEAVFDLVERSARTPAPGRQRGPAAQRGRRPKAADRAATAPRTAAKPKPTVGVQGGDEHQEIQALLIKIGQMQGFHVKSNRLIGARLKPDVLWYRLDPDKDPSHGPHAVFEIERGEAAQLTKSLSSLKHAYDKGCTRLFLIVPERKRVNVEARTGGLVGGSFHEIQDCLKLVAIENCPRDVYELWDYLKSL